MIAATIRLGKNRKFPVAMGVKLTFTVPSILHLTGFVQCFIYFGQEDLFYRASVSSFCIKPFPINVSYQPSPRHETEIPAEKIN